MADERAVSPGAALGDAEGPHGPFSSILALQLLTERVDGSDSADYDSHELNLVLQNGERLNVVDHAGKQVLREEANRLRGLIGCKLWDATSKLV